MATTLSPRHGTRICSRPRADAGRINVAMLLSLLVGTGLLLFALVHLPKLVLGALGTLIVIGAFAPIVRQVREAMQRRAVPDAGPALSEPSTTDLGH